MEVLNLVSPIKKRKAPSERWPKVPRIEYPEDRLVQSYYARHPEVSSLLLQARALTLSWHAKNSGHVVWATLLSEPVYLKEGLSNASHSKARSHAQARDHPVMLNSYEPPPARVFAWRQLRLMREQGLTRKQAQRAVQDREDKEMAQKRCAAPVHACA